MKLSVTKILPLLLTAALPALAPCQVSAAPQNAAPVPLCTAVPSPKGSSSQSPEVSVSDQAQTLYDLRNPYVGDASADGRLLGALDSYLPDTPYTIELYTQEPPYALRLAFSQKPEWTDKETAVLDLELQDAGLLVLALIDNLEEFQWSYPLEEKDTQDGLYTGYLRVEDASQLYSLEDVKEYGQSPEKLEELLEILSLCREARCTVGGADGPTAYFIAGKQKS